MEGLERLDRHWRWWVALVWLVASLWLVYQHWARIRGFALPDTDDNIRIMQVRAWLAGQGWFDLRQYRLNPPDGANIHWSRLVDLPIAGIKLALMPFMSGADAEKAAVTIAPLLPMGVAMAAVSLTVRRMLGPFAFALALAILLCAPSDVGMWSPLRIDHHGWQLAFLAVSVSALTDPDRARGGLTLGISSALSIVIGMEMLPYLALLGAAAVLLWVYENGRDNARQLLAYGASLAGGVALGYALFASYANRAPVCDALSPVWLSALMAAGAIAVALGMLKLGNIWLRLAAAAVGGALVAGAFVHFWPHCLGRLENLDPEAEYLWLRNVLEARPIYRHGRDVIVAVCAIPAIGLLGYLAILAKVRGDGPALRRWLVLAAPAFLAAALLLWQSRAGPAAQILAVPGAVALGWVVIPLFWNSRFMLVRVVGVVAVFVIISGTGIERAMSWLPQKQKGAANKAVDRANGLCPSLWALHPVALVPKGYVLTHVDLGPRLIAVTHHSAVAGPYHRNGRDIAEVMKAFRESADYARSVIDRRHIDYVLVCPGISESTIYASEAPGGFYMQLMRGQVPKWLAPVDLPKDSPFRMWRVVKASAQS
ncbi:MAG: AcrB/AcrD/AcrF family protein [Alphaproteobacteria bacterium]|nr:AcrB/AcrD/AcrF family protein [Alphaproteobacteria bacterium]